MFKAFEIKIGISMQKDWVDIGAIMFSSADIFFVEDKTYPSVLNIKAFLCIFFFISQIEENVKKFFFTAGKNEFTCFFI